MLARLISQFLNWCTSFTYAQLEIRHSWAACSVKEHKGKSDSVTKMHSNFSAQSTSCATCDHLSAYSQRLGEPNFERNLQERGAPGRRRQRDQDALRPLGRRQHHVPHHGAHPRNVRHGVSSAQTPSGTPGDTLGTLPSLLCPRRYTCSYCCTILVPLLYFDILGVVTLLSAFFKLHSDTST